MSHGKRRSSEQKLKAVWEQAGDAMVFLDEDGLLDCNDAALRLLGIDSREHAIGLPLHSFAPPTQPDGRPSEQVFADGRRKVVESGTGRFDWEFRHTDGRTLVLDVILHSLQMGGGQIVHGIFRDVTAQRLAARQLEIARQAAENSLRTLSRQDALTGLPSRSLFLEEGQRQLDACRQADRVCLLCIDVDNFRMVNEAMGETGGRWRVACRWRTTAPLRRLLWFIGPRGERRIRLAHDGLQRRYRCRHRRSSRCRAGTAARRSAIIDSALRSVSALPVLTRRHRAWKA
jgi:PAS domain S-box-containing protein